jgi:Flp pilus assembly protein TadD
MDDRAVEIELTTEQRMELCDELYQAAADLLPELDFESEVDDEARRRLLRAGELLERVIGLRSDDWRAMWVLGKVRQALGDHERAHEAFARAYALDPPDANVPRELAAECVILGKGAEAVAASRRACDLDPADAGLLANLALAYLIDGQIEAAGTAVTEAHHRDPSDPISEYLARLVEAVARSEIEAPSRWPP